MAFTLHSHNVRSHHYSEENLMTPFFKIALSAVFVLMATTATVFARTASPLFPVSPVLADSKADELYPSVAGDFLVYSQRRGGSYSVVRTSKSSPRTASGNVNPTVLNEAIRYGVAVNDGGIGYVSSRMGPIGAWMKQPRGDGHVAIGNMGTFRGAIAPANLHASTDGRVWCFDATMQKIRHSELLNEFANPTSSSELIAQSWRIYNSNLFMHRLGYKATKTGVRNKFNPPGLFIFQRPTSQLSMIINAFDGAISPDGKRIVFVRELNGNYDLFMQNINGGKLVQLTDTPYGEFEPAWSPDGKQVAFVSNRHSRGDVHDTSIYVLNLSDGKAHRITNASGATDGGPAWLDGRHLLFHSNRSLRSPQSRTGGDWNIWQADLSGGF